MTRVFGTGRWRVRRLKPGVWLAVPPDGFNPYTAKTWADAYRLASFLARRIQLC